MNPFCSLFILARRAEGGKTVGLKEVRSSPYKGERTLGEKESSGLCHFGDTTSRWGEGGDHST